MNEPTLFDMQFEPRLPTFPADVSRRKHRDSPESIAANPSVTAKRESHERIKAILREGAATSKEIAEALGYGDKLHLCSGRLSELKTMGQIRPTGQRKDGCAVLEIVR